MKRNEIVKIKFVDEEGVHDFRVEGLWEDVSGNSVSHSVDEGNIAAVNYYMRAIKNDLPLTQVYYGKVGALGYLVHESEFVK